MRRTMQGQDAGSPAEAPPKRRTAGAGSIDQLPSGRWRARARDDQGKQFTLGTSATEAEARALLHHGIRGIVDAGAAPTGPLTLRGWGKTWFTAREGDDIRGITQEKSVWHRHVLGHPIADLPLREITRRQVLDWLAAVRASKAMVSAVGGGHRPTNRPVSRRVVKHALHLLRGALSAARDAELVTGDPTDGVAIPRDKKLRPPAWTFLTPAEIDRVTREGVDALPEPERTIYTVAIYTGLRQGELWALERGDLGDLDGPGPEITVSRSHGGPPKNGKTRRVPLLPEALAALKAHLARGLAGHRLVFPGESGGRRGKSDDARWAPQVKRATRGGEVVHTTTNHYRARAGITRRVRFHDLRHTCASHLVMGTWGVTLSLQEVALWLGHSSITMTERYAHLAPERLATRVASAVGTRESGVGLVRDSGVPLLESRESEEPSETPCFQARPRGVEPLTLGSEVRSEGVAAREVRSPHDSSVTPGALSGADLTHLAVAVLRAQARGEPDPGRARELARAMVLAGVGGADALDVLEGGARWQRSSVALAELALDRVAGTGSGEGSAAG